MNITTVAVAGTMALLVSFSATNTVIDFTRPAPLREAKIQPLQPGNIVIRTDGSVDYPMKILLDVHAHWSGTLHAPSGREICRGGSYLDGDKSPALYEATRDLVIYKDIKWMIGDNCPVNIPEGSVFAFAWTPIDDQYATSGATGVVTKAE